MADPFVDGEDALGALEEDMKRLRHENRELRLTNTSLRARLALLPSEAVLAEGRQAEQCGGAFAEHSPPHSEAETRQGASPPSHLSSDTAKSPAQADAAPPRRRTRAVPPSSSSSTAAEPVSASRIQEAVLAVKKEVQGELEALREALAAERTEKENLKREFELFVSATCEREAAYQVVHTQLYRELEGQGERVRAAQAQLEEQRQQSVEMRRSLEAAVATARAGGLAASSAAAAVVAATSEEGEEDGTMSQASKRRRTAVERPTASLRGKRAPTDVQAAMLAFGGGAPSPVVSTPAGAPVQEGGETAAAAAAAPEASPSSQPDPRAPRALNILSGGAALRSTKRPASTSTATKRTRETASTAFSSLGRVVAGVGLHVPVAPVFARAPAGSGKPTSGAPSTTSGASSSAGVTVPSTTSASSVVAGTGAAVGGRPAVSSAVESLWRLLAHHTEATHGFLPLWQQLAALRDVDRLIVLEVLVALLVHLVGPQGSSAAAFTSEPGNAAGAAAALLPPAFVSQPTSIAVVATAVRLLTVQLEDAALQQRGGGTAEVGRQARVLLSSLFYRLCVATLCRWQSVDTAIAADALEQWSAAVQHLYGFQVDLVRLMQYTNTTAAYHRTRLPHSWITYMAQCIFGQCVCASTSTATALPAETATARWQDLCDSVGWSRHALPLDRLETAAARCVAMARVGHGPFTAACAEEALLALRFVILLRGFDHMERLATLLEQPGVLPMATTKDIYAELVSLAVRDCVPFRTQAALHHAVGMLREYVEEAAPERCTSAEHFVSAVRRSHVMAALALLRVEAAPAGASSSPPSSSSSGGGAVRATEEVVQAGRRVVLQWLQAQKVALEMVRQSASLASDRLLLLRDTPLGRTLLRSV